MVARSFHFDESRLKSLLDDDMPELEQAELNDHLETCASCRHTLERLAAGTRLWAELRELAPVSDLHSNRTAGSTNHDGAARRDGGSGERNHALDFLAPSQATGSLGRLGPYEVTALLGRGGFGVVLKAVDPALGRVVAIKVLAPELATSAAARVRFAREARAAAAVVHDHVVAIHAIDSFNNLPYLVMPFVAGRSLQERVDRDGPLNLKEVLRIGIQTALGLAAAHEQGLVHRDVKPSNILLENGVERVKLTDFGLARAVDDASLTQSGVVTGTPQYMSPEQARGEGVDHRSDLFSLGSVLYFMCAGHSPFRASSTPAVLRRVSDDRPRPLRDVNVEIPDWLAQFVDRLHEKDKAHRLSSATEVAEILGRYLADVQRGVPILATPQGRGASPKRRLASGSKVAAAMMIPALVLGVGAYEKRAAIFSILPTLARTAGPAAGDAAFGNGQDGNVTIIVNENAEPIVGSGNLVTKTWDVANFNDVHIASTFHVDIIKGSAFKVTTTADDNILPHVQVVKEGTTFKLGLAHGSYRLKKPLRAEITLPALKALDIGGASKGTLKGFQSEDELKATISGSSGLAGDLIVRSADIHVDGASTIALVGSAQAARLSAHGSSQLKLGEFVVKQGQIEVEGASTAKISVKTDEPFKATVSGSSNLTGTIQVKQLVLDLDGASQTNLDGTANDAKIGGSGAVSFKLDGLALQNADVKLSGASHGTINVRGKLTYDLSSVSSLKYRGEPTTLDGSTSSGSSISRAR